MKVLIVPSGGEATHIAVLAQVSSILGEHLSSPCPADERERGFHREVCRLTPLPLVGRAGKHC